MARAQVLVERGPCHHRRLHGGVEKPQRIAPGFFGLVHGQIRMLQQLTCRITLSKHAHTNAGTALEFKIAALIGQGQCLQNFLPDMAGLRGRLFVGMVESVEQDHKFIAAQPGYAVALAHIGTQTLCYCQKHQITRCVTTGIVDGLEVVQVNEQQRTLETAAWRNLERMRQAVLEQAAVG